MSYTGCRTGSSSITGMTFYRGGSYPAAYNGALFFGDHSRNEIWAMMPGTNGLPDPGQRQCLVCVDSTGAGAGHPVDLEIGPNGDLFYVNMDNGTIHRVTHWRPVSDPDTGRRGLRAGAAPFRDRACAGSNRGQPTCTRLHWWSRVPVSFHWSVAAPEVLDASLTPSTRPLFLLTSLR